MMHDLYGDEIYTALRREDFIRDAEQERVLNQIGKTKRKHPAVRRYRVMHLKIFAGTCVEDKKTVMVEVR